MTEEKRIFVRKTSGLVRTIGWFSAMVFGVHCISLSSSGLIPYAWVPWLWPGSDLIAVLTVSMLLCLLHATTYAQIGSIYPRSGSDYVLGSRLIHPAIQFAASFSFVIFTFLTAGSLIAWIPSSVLPSFYWSWGVIFNDPGALAVAEWVKTPEGVFLIGLLFVFITWLTTILPTKHVVNILNAGFFLGTIAWILIYIALLACPGPDAFARTWDKFMGAGNFEKVIPTAEANGLEWSTAPWWLMALAGTIMGFWIYYGYYIPSFFAGELKEAPKTLIISGWGSLIYTWLIFTLGAALMYPRLFSLKWLAAEGYIFYNCPDALPSLPFSTFFGSILWYDYVSKETAPLAIGFIAFAWIYTLINLAQTYFFYGSRILFAMAFDRALPNWIAYVHSKLRSPIVSVTLAAIGAAIGVYLSVYTVIFVQFNFVLYACVVQLLPVTAAILYPFVRKEEFERAPSIVRFKIGPIPGITLIGIGTLLYLLWMIISQYLFPAVGGAIGLHTVAWFASFFVGGLIIFYVMRWYRLKTEGIDILWAYKEIPPI
ncbi:MAG: hypothetical protein DRJ38_07410 [Thermoprotei archaeon]|nr:MAG: hypothetical protein DRJ38_07410 [Thermoprotei archaeon]